jgi:hypothetical protein
VTGQQEENPRPYQTSTPCISLSPEGKCAEADTAPKTVCRILPEKAFFIYVGVF